MSDCLSLSLSLQINSIPKLDTWILISSFAWRTDRLALAAARAMRCRCVVSDPTSCSEMRREEMRWKEMRWEEMMMMMTMKMRGEWYGWWSDGREDDDRRNSVETLYFGHILLKTKRTISGLLELKYAIVVENKWNWKRKNAWCWLRIWPTLRA